MAEKITGQVQEIFADKEQWDAFIELAPNKDNIKNDWLARLKPCMNKLFAVDNIVDEWEYDSTGDEYNWYLKDYGKESLFLAFWWDKEYTEFGLYAGKSLDLSLLKQKLREKEYKPIISAFDHLDYHLEEDDDRGLLRDWGNFCFGDISYKNLDAYSLAWYANYKTEEFASQIQQKVNKYIKDKDITKLFKELNESTNKELNDSTNKKRKTNKP
jgi:hypothetical protein